MRKCRNIYLPKSHSFCKEHCESTAFVTNQDNDICLNSTTAQESLFCSSNQPKPAQDHQDLEQEKLRKELLATSIALPGKNTSLDNFSISRRSSTNSYHPQQQTRNTLLGQSDQNIQHESSLNFDGFDRLVEDKRAVSGSNSNHPLNFPSESLLGIETLQPVESRRPDRVKQTTDLQPSNTSTPSFLTPQEEYRGQETDPTTPQLSAGKFQDSMQHLKFNQPKHMHPRESKNNYCLNPFHCFKKQHFIINPQSTFMFFWLCVVAFATIYNLWTAIMRQAFHEVQNNKTALWICLDGIADIIYLADILVQLRTSYLEKGLVVKNARKMATRYLWSKNFALDGLSLLPLDLFQMITGIQPLLRFPRFLKCFRAWHWKVLVENRTTFPNSWRVLTLVHILFLGCHWFASIYYMLSKSTQFQDSWGYPAPTTPELQSLLRKYLQSFYWATMTLTTIGDIMEPKATFQYAFTITTYLIGVFVFATIVGQVSTIINNKNADRLSFENLLDNAKSYMSTHHVPQRLRKRVIRWYDYAWERRRLFGENDLNCLGHLPEKLKTELALHVHLETLRKVSIFRECRPEFLYDLVLKMRPFIFTPGDLICRKGEVAREMFIIADGVLEVIGKAGIVLKRLEAGDFFGEIGILCVNGNGNKRTADVRAVGYAELFLLSREDVLSALADHPDAHAVIMKRATQRLLENKNREDAQFAFTQRPSDLNLFDTTLSRGTLPESLVMRPQPYGTTETSICDPSLSGINRPSNDTTSIAPVTATTTTTAHNSTHDTEESLFQKRGKDTLASLANLNRFIEEAMFCLPGYSEKIAARNGRINALVAENTFLKRELMELKGIYGEFAKDSDSEVLP